MERWLLILGLISAGITTVGLIYAKILRPIAKVVVLAETAVPVVLDIAHEFRNNGGSTLKDTLDAMTKGVQAIKHVLEVHVEAEEHINRHMNRRMLEIEQRTRALETHTAIPLQRRADDAPTTA